MNKSVDSRIMKRSAAVVLLLFTVCSCSTYPNKFKCGDARGLGCTMLREIDRQIDSGQIEEVYKDKNNARARNRQYRQCSGGICCSYTTSEELNLKKQDIADIYQEELDNNLDDEHSLRF